MAVNEPKAFRYHCSIRSLSNSVRAVSRTDLMASSLRPRAQSGAGRPMPDIAGGFVCADLNIGEVERFPLAGVKATVSRDSVAVGIFRGPRSELFPLFALADDSSSQIEKYIGLGEVFVACGAREIIGHLQLIATGADWEIKSLAVIERQRRQGIGRLLVRAVLHHAFSAGGARVVVATATADIGNLRFYQRLGFRMDRIERDAFTVAEGYPASDLQPIPVRDRVWFSMSRREFNCRRE